MIKAICKNCRFLKEMESPYVGCNYYYCGCGSLAPDTKPENECIQIIPSFTPLDELLVEEMYIFAHTLMRGIKQKKKLKNEADM